jgi:hypothetical protein
MESAATTLPIGVSIEELLDWRPGFGVITVCVEIDPADRSEGWLIELHKQLRSAIETGDDAHDRGRALTATAQRVLDPSKTRAAVGALPDRLLRGRRAGARHLDRGGDGRLSHECRYAARPLLVPLLKLLTRGAAIGAIAISAERIHLYEWKLGALDLITTGRRRCTASTGASEGWEALRRGPDRGASPARAATSTTSGLNTTGRDSSRRPAADRRRARGRGWRRVIAFGDPEHVREFDQGAEKGTEVELAEAVDVIREERAKLLERVNAAVADGNRRRELALIERAIEGARTPGGHGALGLIDVQECLNEGRVEHLIFDASSEDPGLTEIEDLVERAIRTSAKVMPVEGDAADQLQESDGVAAVLRY